MQRRVGIREAKAKLSHYIDLALSGEDVVLTDRGTPVVRLVAVATTGASEADVLRELADLGVLEPAKSAPPLHRPIRPAGNTSISGLVREQRR